MPKCGYTNLFLTKTLAGLDDEIPFLFELKVPKNFSMTTFWHGKFWYPTNEALNTFHNQMVAQDLCKEETSRIQEPQTRATGKLT